RAVVVFPREWSVARRWFKEERRGGWHNTRTTHFRIKQPAGSQRDVPDNLTFDSKAGSAREEPVVLILLVQRGRDLGRLAIGGAVHDGSMEMFEAPLMFHEIAGQPIQQLRMGWGVTLHSEILGCAHETDAEVSLP